MDGNTVAKKCARSIDSINKLINKAVKEIKIANARAETAEKMIESIRLSAQEELKKAYEDGYKKGLEDANKGGSSKEEDAKLILTNNN